MNPSPYRAPYKSAHVRALIVKILLIVGAVATLLSLLTEAVSLAFPPLTEDQEVVDNPAGTVIVLMISLLALLRLIVYLATVVFFVVWLYRAYDNLRAFNPRRHLDHSPAWAVGSFFVPFVNLVVPYRAVKEVWQKSGTLEEPILSDTNTPVIFPVWWTFWLCASFAGRISMRVSSGENVEPSTATIIEIVANALAIIAAILAYMVVDAIDQKQEETSQKVNLGRYSGPPPPPPSLPLPHMVTPEPSANNPQPG